MALIRLAPLADSVLTVASEVIAAVKAGLALSVAVIAAWYACRLAAVGSEEVDHRGGPLGLHVGAELSGRYPRSR